MIIWFRSFSVIAYKISLLPFIDTEDVPSSTSALILETEISEIGIKDRIGNI